MRHNEEKTALSRRAFVGRLAVGTAGAAVALAGGLGRAQASVRKQSVPGRQDNEADKPLAATTAGEQPGSVEVSKPGPWELLRPLAVGAAVGHGWHVAGFTGEVAGSCVLTLENEKGRAHRVHVCRNDGRPQGLVYTEQFDLVVMNGGQGDLPTDEGFAQAVAEVAHVVAANERSHGKLVTALLPQAERERRFADTARLR